MSFLISYSGLIAGSYVLPGAEKSQAFERFRNSGLSVPLSYVRSTDEIPPEHRNVRYLLLSPFRGRAVTGCPGSKGHRCCNYRTSDVYEGCALGCSYCVLQGYLNCGLVVVHTKVDPVVRWMQKASQRLQGLPLRVGTGETGDSLLYDPLFGLSRELIEAAARCKGLELELKTKTDHVDHLLDITDKGRAVIGFSLNAHSISAQEEGCSASLEERLSAAERAVSAGYRVAFHFDPIIRFAGWEDEYRETVAMLGRFKSKDVAWISMGTVRYHPALREAMGMPFYLGDEFVRCKDGKYRYLQPVRRSIYTYIKGEIEKRLSAPTYLCMESDTMWKMVYGNLPGRIPALRAIFARRRRLP